MTHGGGRREIKSPGDDFPAGGDSTLSGVLGSFVILPIVWSSKRE
jgi:hypothetical protein